MAKLLARSPFRVRDSAVITSSLGVPRRCASASRTKFVKLTGAWMLTCMAAFQITAVKLVFKRSLDVKIRHNARVNNQHFRI